MNTQHENFKKFHDAHFADKPLVLVNCWDSASAAIIAAQSECLALGTSSAGVAAATGHLDDESLDARTVVEATSQICAMTDKPVTVDIEGGYVDTAELGPFVARLTECGAVGVNIEDFHKGRLLPAGTVIERIRAIKAEANRVGRPVFVNARTEAFWRPEHFDDSLTHAMERIRAFQQAGADGVFIPGVQIASDRSKLVRSSLLPVNFLLTPDTSISELAHDGASRISLGSAPIRAAMATLSSLTKSALSWHPEFAETVSYLSMQETLALARRKGLSKTSCASDS